MDVFEMREDLVRDYGAFVRSFVDISDQRISKVVEQAFGERLLWPSPLVQLNPSFERGGLIDELVDDAVLHESCRDVFRLKSKDNPEDVGRPMRLHKHQDEAIRIARTGANYVLTTGTGSGKSLSYIIPIVDHVLRNGTGKGIQAIVVYPMNALANSQIGELEKFLETGVCYGRPPVKVRRYTGQETREERQEICDNPPDVILTNYVMLELILTRVNEKAMVRVLTAVENGGAGRSKMVALGGVGLS